MKYIFPILGILYITSLILNYISFISKKSAIEIVNEMGMGYNLGDLFDCYMDFTKINNPDEQITLFGNEPPTKETIHRLKKYGFKTIRFPITWTYFIDEFDNIKSEWMSRVKEVIDWIIDKNMYCIINMHRDGDFGNWLFEGIKSLEKYKKIWAQISNEFKDYDDHLIFESMNDPQFYTIDGFDFITLFNFTQAFINTVRNSGGKNIERLLLISGAINKVDYSFYSNFTIPTDPFDKIAFSLHYYDPTDFTFSYDAESSWYDDEGNLHKYSSIKKWGSDSDYNQLVNNFENIKKNFIDKGFPVIIVETGIYTGQGKEKESIIEYIYALFSMSSSYNGIMSCLFDTSQSKSGEIKFYQREKDKWYDEDIRDIFKKISKNKFVNPTDYYIMTNHLTRNILDPFGNLVLNIGNKKPTKVIFNLRRDGFSDKNIFYEIISYDNKGKVFLIQIGDNYRKNEYDRTITYNYDIHKKEFYNLIEVDKLFRDNITQFNYLKIEFKEYFLSIDMNSYKEAISNYI